MPLAGVIKEDMDAGETEAKKKNRKRKGEIKEDSASQEGARKGEREETPRDVAI